MAKNSVKISARVIDTVRPTVAGAGRNPAVDAVRALFGRITTPLLPDDYLKLANPLWSARELRGRVVDVRRETEDSATLVIKKAGEVEYYCRFHPNMKAKIDVTN